MVALRAVLFIVAGTATVLATRTLASTAGRAARALTGGGLRRAARRRAGARCGGEVDVSDLGLTLSDLEKPIPAIPDGPAVVITMGVESSSGIPGKRDESVCWRETRETVDVTLAIPGLRGQPAAAMLAELTETTATITVFGRTIWSCVLRGRIDPRASTSSIRMDGMQPVVDVSAYKVDPERWNGFIESIGVDSVLQ